MPERSWIVNASPLTLLGKIARLDLLSALTSTISVPQTVLNEVLAGPDAPTIPAEWCVPDAAVTAEVVAWGIDAGESQVVATALGLTGCTAVLDDRAARRCAKALGVSVLGTLGVVLLARREGIIGAARPLITELRQQGLWLADSLVDAALADVGE